MFLWWTAICSYSSDKRDHLQTSYQKVIPVRIFSEPFTLKPYRCPSCKKLGGYAASVVRASSQSNSNSSPEEVERKRQYLERKYRFFEKEYAVVQLCSVCEGSGKLACKFCNGTGFMTLGDTLLCSVSGNCDCVVCNARGELDCEHCRGTGHIAGWL